MIYWLPSEMQLELKELSSSFGQPLLHTANLPHNSYLNSIDKLDRTSEVCMVIRRPTGRLLTMSKTYYPNGVYRLLTGGVHLGESILHSLLRETYEETGLQTQVKLFLSAVTYSSTEVKRYPLFATFAFLLDEVGGNLSTLDSSEQIAAFSDVEPTNLLVIAEQLESLECSYSSAINSRWDDWGRFRAIIHRIVWESIIEKVISQSPRA